MKTFALVAVLPYLVCALVLVFSHQALAQDATCAANPQCSNLDGDCCPSITSDGLEVDLFCCGSGEDTCETNPKCAALNLTGTCCPAANGLLLDCCERPFAQCKAHPDCSKLAGDCCPTPSGMFLTCCLDDLSLVNVTFPPTDELAACSANSACVGLADDCCPTRDGTFLCTYRTTFASVATERMDTVSHISSFTLKTAVENRNETPTSK
jgi:hypothetical protein